MAETDNWPCYGGETAKRGARQRHTTIDFLGCSRRWPRGALKRNRREYLPPPRPAPTSLPDDACAGPGGVAGGLADAGC